MREEVIINLDLQQDEGDYAKLAQLKGSLINIKEEQARLNKAYKDGNITVKELASETVRLEANQKKLSNAYTETQRKITGLKSPFEKLNESIKEQANQVQVAGFSLASFANPVTATVGLLGGLFKAYASSTIGAKDLEHASTALNSALNMTANSVAAIISGGGEGGEGFFSKLAKTFNAAVFGLNTAILGEVSANIKEQLDDLGREEIMIRSEVNQRLEDNAVILAKMAESQVDITEKQALAGEAIRNLRANEEALLGVKEKQLKALEFALALDKENETLQDAVLMKEQEISNIKRDVERKVQAIIKLESNLVDAANNQAAAEAKKTAELEKQKKLLTETNEQIIIKGTENNIKKIEQDQELFAKSVQMAIDLGNMETEIDKQTVDENYEYRKKKADEEFEKEKERRTKSLTFVKGITEGITGILVAGLQSNAEIGKQILKSYLITVARMLKGWLITKVIGESFASPDSVLSFGVTGAIRAGVMTALIEGAFAGIESFIAGFAQGGVVSGTKIEDRHGKRIKRSNGDNRLVTVKTGEVILNERQQAALGGDETFRKLGVPGFAHGGYVPALANPSPEYDMIKRLMYAMNKRQVAVVIEDVELKMSQRARIREQATL